MKLLMLLCCIGYTMAWWCRGHMLTAMIAQLDLETDAKDSFDQAQSVIGLLGGDWSHDKSNMFVESACWADDIKGYGFRATNSWHYIDKQYIEDGSVTPSSTQESDYNVVWAIAQAVGTLKNRNHTSGKLETALMLRYLIHCVGDLHQPLHATSMFNLKHPDGDRGGNSFAIKFDSLIKNLHSLWDTALGELERDLDRPLSSSNLSAFKDYTQNFMKRYPRLEFEIELKDDRFNNWAEESFNIAKSHVYQGINENEKPTDDYIQTGIEIANKQIALAGYRIADLIREVYPSSNLKIESI